MSRMPRIFIDGMTQHVIQRGNNRSDIFKSVADYEMFSDCLQEASIRCGFRIHAYVLMTNHFHVMATGETAGSIPRAMQAIGRRYVPYFNRRYSRTGTLFEGRYRSILLGDERYWYACLRYVEMNPVRAGLVETPDLYRWSSYRAHALGIRNAVLTEHPLYLRLGETAPQRELCWRIICANDKGQTLCQSATGSDPH